MNDDVPGFDRIGLLTHKLVAGLALRRNPEGDAVAHHATPVEEVETAVNMAIAALRALLDAMQAPDDAADDLPAQRKRQA